MTIRELKEILNQVEDDYIVCINFYDPFEGYKTMELETERIEIQKREVIKNSFGGVVVIEGRIIIR